MKNREFKKGDRIQFEYFGKTERGSIVQVGINGYWVRSDHGRASYGTASIRCPFGSAKEIE